MSLPPAGKPDPLSDPAQYTRSAVEDKVAPSPLATQAMTSSTVAAKTKDMPAPSNGKPENTLQLPPMPLGSRSILDAQVVATEAPAQQMPPGSVTVSAPKAAQATPPSQPQGPMLNAFTAASSVPSVAATGAGANAFSPGGAPTQVASAFGSAPMSQPAWQPTPAAG
jgi:hypothetical protein